MYSINSVDLIKASLGNAESSCIFKCLVQLLGQRLFRGVLGKQETTEACQTGRKALEIRMSN